MKSLTIYFSLLLLLLPYGCAPRKSLFVLMPDPDGTVGVISVTNRGGTQIIDKPGHVTEVKDAATMPAPPRPMAQQDISRIFGAAISAQPAPPINYLLYFKTGTADLTEDSLKMIPEIIATIAARKSSDITVTGHTDTVGTRERNYQLAFNRAVRVKEIFVSQGVDPNVISVDSHGEDNPLIKSGDEVNEPRNRRVEITVR